MELRTAHVQAANPKSAATKLRQLLKSADSETRFRLAENQSSPPDVLAKLAKDCDPEIRACVANNPSTPDNLVKTLAKDVHDDVRFSMACNPCLPLEVLHDLSQDQNPYVSDRAHKTLDGVALELDLEQQGFVSLPSPHARLGELLVASGILEEKEIEVAITFAQKTKLPLGRALVEGGRIDRSTIAHALKQQTLIRLGQLSLEVAIETITEYTRRQQYLR
jgi:hypothetical protein